MRIKIVPTMAYLFVCVLVINLVDLVAKTVSLSMVFNMVLLALVMTGMVFSLAGVFGKIQYQKAINLNRFFMNFGFLVVIVLLVIQASSIGKVTSAEFLKVSGIFMLGVWSVVLYNAELIASSFYLGMVKPKSE